jgi:hypothetical protein
MKRLIEYSLLIAIAIFVSCKKEYSCENCADKKNNKPPISVAGPDQLITLPTDSVLLDGSTSSDPDGSISNYLWTKISGPASSNINKPADSITKVKALVAGNYLFELKVTDNGGLSAKDTMRVTVDSVFTPIHPPIANAGTDQTITLPTNSVTLDGSGSSDPDNNILSYAWKKISGPSSLNIVNASAVQTQVTSFAQGTYMFELKVTDASGLFSIDTMQVIVNPATSINLPPIAKAGNDTTILSNQSSCAPVLISVTLNGSNSYDTDGSITSYLWTGPNVITNPNAATTTFTGSIQGIITFTLKVTDNNGAVGYDTIRISILPGNRPLVPAQLIPISTLSQARVGVTIAAAGNKILIAGGGGTQPGQCNTSRIDIYDISTNSWAIAELSVARAEMAVAVLGNKIFFGGGEAQKTFPNTTTCYKGPDTKSSAVDIYDASSNTWSIAQLSSPRITTGTSAGNKVIFAGGADLWEYTQWPSNVVDIYDASTNSWTNTLLTEYKGFTQIATSGTKVYLAGGAYTLTGWAGHGLSKRIDIYDASSGSWSVDYLNNERGAMGAISANNKIFWAGGAIIDVTNLDVGYDYTSSVEIRNLATNTTSFECLVSPSIPIAFRKDDKLVFIHIQGGNMFDIYDLSTGSWSIGVTSQTIPGQIVSYNNTLYATDGSMLYKLEL